MAKKIEVIWARRPLVKKEPPKLSEVILEHEVSIPIGGEKRRELWEGYNQGQKGRVLPHPTLDQLDRKYCKTTFQGYWGLVL